MIDFYKYIYKISNKNKFWFVFIIITFIILLRKKNIKLSHILGLFLGVTICFYLNSYHISNNTSEIEIYEERKKKIKFNYEDKYSNIINFIYKLNDLKQIDDRNYNLFILCIRKFIQLDKDFEYLLKANSNKDFLVQCILKMNDYKNKSFDYLLAISLSNNNKQVLKKIEQSIDRLDDILGSYIRNNKITNLDYNNDSKLFDLVELNIKPYNYSI